MVRDHSRHSGGKSVADSTAQSMVSQGAVDGPARRERRHHGHQYDLGEDRQIAGNADGKVAEQGRRPGRRPQSRRARRWPLPAAPNKKIATPPPMAPPLKPSSRKWRWNCPAMKPSVAPTKCSTSMIGRLVAMAPRVANITDSMVTARPGPRRRRRPPPPFPPWRACGRSSGDDRRGSRRRPAPRAPGAAPRSRAARRRRA